MLTAYGRRDIGKQRHTNQDYVYLSEEPVGNLPTLFIVADGMGGHNAGDLASKYAVEKVVEAVEKNMQRNPYLVLRSAISYANQKVIEKAREDESLKGMGTTIVAATISDSQVCIANVGDSRLYVMGEELKQITVDHSLVEEMVRIGEITKEAARVHPDKNIITRAVGAAETVDVDFFDWELQKGETLLLCSDGLTNMVEDAEIAYILQKYEKVEEQAGQLIAAANRNGGRDNIAVVIIKSC